MTTPAHAFGIGCDSAPGRNACGVFLSHEGHCPYALAAERFRNDPRDQQSSNSEETLTAMGSSVRGLRQRSHVATIRPINVL